MLYLLQDAPAQTINYFIAGYAVIFSVMALYLVSLIVRRSNLMRDLETLEELQESKS